MRAALYSDAAAARSPSRAVRALVDHKLGGPIGRRRYSAPSYELRHPERGCLITLPGFNPIEAYEAAIASLAPELVRLPRGASLQELLLWAGEPLATAEVAAVMQLDPAEARNGLGRFARPIPAGAEF